MKYRLLACFLAAAIFFSACSPASRCQNWAAAATDANWQARYRLLFHQKDGDLELQVVESRGETIVLDIQGQGGSIRLEYSPDKFSIALAEGDLWWEDFPRQVPYYALSELARQFADAEKLSAQGDWATLAGFRLRVKKGVPMEASFLQEWTLSVEEFNWAPGR